MGSKTMVDGEEAEERAGKKRGPTHTGAERGTTSTHLRGAAPTHQIPAAPPLWPPASHTCPPARPAASAVQAVPRCCSHPPGVKLGGQNYYIQTKGKCRAPASNMGEDFRTVSPAHDTRRPSELRAAGLQGLEGSEGPWPFPVPSALSSLWHPPKCTSKLTASGCWPSLLPAWQVPPRSSS